MTNDQKEKIIRVELLETFAEINDILKADKDVEAVEGNLAKFDENGNPVDSGINVNDLSAVTTTGDYNDLLNTPTIPSVGDAEIEIQKNGTKINSFTTNQSGSKVTINISVPTGTAADKNVPSSGNASATQVVMGNDTRLSDSRPASDVYEWAKASTKPSYTLDEVSDGSTRKLSDKIGKTIEITWANLKSLRDNSQLTPGQWYRITDYTCTTIQKNTQSAGHVFDIIVRADSTNALNENAYAAKHAGDTYFADSKLEAWKLLYCLDNDTDRFVWADSTNGKGVIYRMIDENDNECPYDFKNIQFKVGANTTAGTVANVFYYTFSVASGTNDATVTDHSLHGGYCCRNKVGERTQWTIPVLNEIVFRNTSASSTCICNTFERGSYRNTFGNNCSYNTFGNNCYLNTFGNNCSLNTFGNYCYSNMFSDSCGSNTFGKYCNSNTFGSSCGSNTFGNNCNSNTFSDSCGSNTVGNNCNYNTFGSSCYYNTFGSSCSYIKFGTSSTTKDYCRYIIVENGNQYLYLGCSATTSSYAYFQNVKIAQGVNNTSTYKTITHATAGDIFQTVYKPKNSVEVSV